MTFQLCLCAQNKSVCKYSTKFCCSFKHMCRLLLRSAGVVFFASLTKPWSKGTSNLNPNSLVELNGPVLVLRSLSKVTLPLLFKTKTCWENMGLYSTTLQMTDNVEKCQTILENVGKYIQNNCCFLKSGASGHRQCRPNAK